MTLELDMSLNFTYQVGKDMYILVATNQDVLLFKLLPFLGVLLLATLRQLSTYAPANSNNSLCRFAVTCIKKLCIGPINVFGNRGSLKALIGQGGHLFALGQKYNGAKLVSNFLICSAKYVLHLKVGPFEFLEGRDRTIV